MRSRLNGLGCLPLRRVASVIGDEVLGNRIEGHVTARWRESRGALLP